MPTLEERITRLEDESAIRQIVARFADACVVGDYEALCNLWTPDTENLATWILSEPFPMTAKSRDQIKEMCDKLGPTREFFHQGVGSGVININGNKASARWIMREVARGPGERYYANYAVYEDDMEKRDGQWYFVKRHFHYNFLDSSKFEGTSFALDLKQKP